MNERGSQFRYARALEIIVFFKRQMKIFKYELFEQGNKLCIRLPTKTFESDPPAAKEKNTTEIDKKRVGQNPYSKILILQLESNWPRLAP